MSLGKIKIIIFIILASFFVPIEISAQRYSFETMEEFYELQDEEEYIEEYIEQYNFCKFMFMCSMLFIIIILIYILYF